MLKNGLFTATLVLMILGVLAPLGPAHAQGDEFTLEGLKGIYVDASGVDESLQAQGLRPNRVKSDTEKRLKQAGIPVVSDKEFDRLKQSQRYPLAVLEIRLEVADLGRTDLRLHMVTVQARQIVYLARKPVVKLLSTTWERRKIVGGGGLDLVKGALAEGIEQFITAFSSANR